MLPRPQLQTPLQPLQSPPLSTLHSLCGPQQVSLQLCSKVGSPPDSMHKECSCDDVLTLLPSRRFQDQPCRCYPECRDTGNSQKHNGEALPLKQLRAVPVCGAFQAAWQPMPSCSEAISKAERAESQQIVIFQQPWASFPAYHRCSMYSTLRSHSWPAVVFVPGSPGAHAPEQSFDQIFLGHTLFLLSDLARWKPPFLLCEQYKWCYQVFQAMT